MKVGVLEVLLVSAEGLRNTSLFGHPGYYVILQCGNKAYNSKITSGRGKKPRWNEKFVFKFPLSEWRNLNRLSFRIMDKDTFTEDDFVGEIIIHLGGIVTEGMEMGCVELKSAPYNVVLEDGTYKGEIKIGLKFIANVEVQREREGSAALPKQPPRPFYKALFNFRQFPWPSFYFF